MSKWIEADALKEKLIQYIALTNGFDRAFSEAPSIDIVRCKECIHKRYDATNDMYQCKKTFHRFYNTDHFCSYGEREDE